MQDLTQQIRELRERLIYTMLERDRTKSIQQVINEVEFLVNYVINGPLKVEGTKNAD